MKFQSIRKFRFLLDIWSNIIEPRREKTAFCICENKYADQLCGSREADERLVFATRIVQSIFYLNPKFQASSHLLWVYSLVCVRPGRKSRRPVFSQRGSMYGADMEVGLHFYGDLVVKCSKSKVTFVRICSRDGLQNSHKVSKLSRPLNHNLISYKNYEFKLLRQLPAYLSRFMRFWYGII